MLNAKLTKPLSFFIKVNHGQIYIFLQKVHIGEMRL